MIFNQDIRFIERNVRGKLLEHHWEETHDVLLTTDAAVKLPEVNRGGRIAPQSGSVPGDV